MNKALKKQSVMFPFASMNGYTDQGGMQVFITVLVHVVTSNISGAHGDIDSGSRPVGHGFQKDFCVIFDPSL